MNMDPYESLPILGSSLVTSIKKKGKESEERDERRLEREIT
jgi:hypothetical protein